MSNQKPNKNSGANSCHRKPKPGDIEGKIEIKDDRERKDGPGGN